MIEELKDLLMAFLIIEDQATWAKGMANRLDYKADYANAQQALAMRYMERLSSIMRVHCSEKGKDHFCNAVMQQVEKTHEAIKQSLLFIAGKKQEDGE